METTFGKPQHSFPYGETVLCQIKEFCVDALQQGDVPVLLCYSLGKGQEVLAGLSGVDFPIYLHTAHWNMSSLYREFGVRLPFFRKYQAGQELDGVLICASGCRRGAWFNGLSRIRTAYISGWALDKGAKWRFRTDAAFALSDHAGYDDLLEYCRLAGAQTSTPSTASPMSSPPICAVVVTTRSRWARIKTLLRFNLASLNSFWPERLFCPILCP